MSQSYVGQSVLAQHTARSGTLCRPSRERNAGIKPQEKASQHCQRPSSWQGCWLLRQLPSLFTSFHFPSSSWDISSPVMDSDSSCGYPFESGLGDINHRGFGLPGLSTPPSSTLQRGSRWAAENPPRGKVDG